MTRKEKCEISIQTSQKKNIFLGPWRSVWFEATATWAQCVTFKSPAAASVQMKDKSCAGAANGLVAKGVR